MSRGRVAAWLAAVAAIVCTLPAPAAAKLPRGFVGVVADGPLLDPGVVDMPSELDLMKRTGVQSVRATFPWSAGQPFASFDDIPSGQRGAYQDEDGVPTSFAETDALVRETAQRGLRLLPVVLYSPPWAAIDPNSLVSPPSDPASFSDYLSVLARRYGSNGAFWAENPSVPRQPVRDWQIWNEPNIAHYWPQPFARSYVSLLRQAHTALDQADPRARLILGGLTNDSWNALVKIYKAGGRRWFDAVALHPYTRHVRGLVKILAYVRYGMKRFHDARKPILITELSWPSAKGKVSDHGFNEVTERQQARRVSAAYELLAKYRRHFGVESAYWYTWMSQDRGPYYFDYAGLRKLNQQNQPTSKPAYRAFRQVVRRITR